MHRFFTLKNDEVNLEDKKVIIKSSESLKHSKSLRLAVDEELEICHEQTEYICKIETINSDEIILSIMKISEEPRESEIKIDIFQGLTKGQKLDMIVQKNVEVGCQSVQIFDSQRTIRKLDNKKTDKLLERLNKISYEAAKQSKRTYAPEVKGIITFDSMIDSMKAYDIFIVLYEDEKDTKISEVLETSQSKIGIVVGPEGGFDLSEVEKLKSNGAVICSLGRRILRTETAGIVASAIIQSQIGDM